VTSSHDTAAPKYRKTPRVVEPVPEPIPDVDESVRTEARAVGLVAVLFAAGISAQALYALGLLIGLSPWTAWMLPGAMDLYAFESTRVASRVPARHPSRAWAVWNARLALSFTVASNALFHALHLASGHRGWTNTDIALTAVSAVPPVIVERFLHLQTKINATAVRAPAATDNTPPLTVDTDKRQTAATDNTPQPETGNPGGNRTDNTAPPATDKPRANRQTPAAKATDNTVNAGGEQPTTKRWVEIGKPVYEAVKAATGKRPAEGPFTEALAAEVARLIAAGQLSAVYANPSPSTAKRIRGEVETKFPHLAPLRPVPDDIERAAS
jgi:hypothetical protein